MPRAAARLTFGCHSLSKHRLPAAVALFKVFSLFLEQLFDLLQLFVSLRSHSTIRQAETKAEAGAEAEAKADTDTDTDTGTSIGAVAEAYFCSCFVSLTQLLRILGCLGLCIVHRSLALVQLHLKSRCRLLSHLQLPPVILSLPISST